MSAYPDGRLVNSALLPKYIGQIVRLPGKVLKIGGDETVVESSDGGQVHITKIAADDVLPPVGHYVEVIGTVQVVENSIRSIKTVGMGDNLDLRIVDGLIALTFKHPQIYHAEP